jgi:hypothetical protein
VLRIVPGSGLKVIVVSTLGIPPAGQFGTALVVTVTVVNNPSATVG